MKINLVYVNTGGNPTVLVLTLINRLKQVSIAKKIMEQIPTCEQVGFIERAKNLEAICRLQMMGGEFCGNALRALVMWLVFESKNKVNKFAVESSGTKELVSISASFRPLLSKVNILLPENRLVFKKAICLKTKTILAKMVVLSGSSFFLVPEKYFSEDINFSLFFKTLYRNKKFKSKACGIIFYKQISKNKYALNPIIYVKQTKTIIRETSCASGSLALAIGLNLKAINVMQPSKYYLNVRLNFKKATISGKSYKPIFKSLVI